MRRSSILCAHLHIHLTEVTVAVLDDVCVFCAVEHRQRSFVALRSDVIVRRVDGDGGQVHKQVTDESNACTLNTGLKTNKWRRAYICTKKYLILGKNNTTCRNVLNQSTVNLHVKLHANKSILGTNHNLL